MGLDITAYPTAVLLPEHPYSEGTEAEGWADACYEQGHVLPMCYDSHQRSIRGLRLTQFHPEAGGYWTGPCYQTDGKALSFGAGSYVGYNRFRAELCRAALGVEPETVWEHPDRYGGEPFFEIINFADNEGTIGPDAAADLADDFVRYGERVLPLMMAADPGYEDWTRGKYMEWTKAFRLAAGGGLVRFH